MVLVHDKLIPIGIITLLSFFFWELYAASKLPILSAKQDIKNIRYLSKNGLQTYYQRRSGSLYLATKFKLFEIVKGKRGDEYSITSSHHKKKLAISVNKNYHTLLSIRKPLDIYITAMGEESSRFIGKGVSPRLHLKDSWISYYNHTTKVATFKNLNNNINDFIITLGAHLNPYFRPQIIMLNENEILYSDINNKGLIGLIHFNRNTKVFTPYHKAQTPAIKLELCLGDHSIYINKISLSEENSASSIYKAKIPLKKLSLQEKDIIYKSQYNDIGKLICAGVDEKLYFIKNTSNNSGKEFFEAAAIDLKDNNKVSIISDLKNVTRMFYQGDRIIIPMYGHHYVLYGTHKLIDDNIESDKVKNK